MATSNKMRALNRLPYDFEDGLKVKNVDIEDLFAEQKAYTDSLVMGETVLSVTGHAANTRLDLTTEQVSKPIIRITGVLTTNITITVPYNTNRPLVFVHSATGAFTVTLKNLIGDGNLSVTSIPLVLNQRKTAYTTYADIVEVASNLYNAQLTGTPTAPTATLGDSSNNVATTAFVFNNKPAFAQGENGYYVDPVSLFLIQWGVTRYGPNYGDYSFVDSPMGANLVVPFTYSFSMNTYTVTATGSNLASPPTIEGSEMSIGIQSSSLSGGTFLVARVAGSNPGFTENGEIHWQAIGKAFS